MFYLSKEYLRVNMILLLICFTDLTYSNPFAERFVSLEQVVQAPSSSSMAIQSDVANSFFLILSEYDTELNCMRIAKHSELN
ncbi:hypothetical protein ACFLRY_00615 [Bacteroidota bacterium]